MFRIWASCNGTEGPAEVLLRGAQPCLGVLGAYKPAASHRQKTVFGLVSSQYVDLMAQALLQAGAVSPSKDSNFRLTASKQPHTLLTRVRADTTACWTPACKWFSQSAPVL